MYIGKLNQRIPIHYRLTKHATDALPVLVENGNPFAGELLRASWKDLIASGINMHIVIPEGYLLNTLVVHLAEDSAPSSMVICSPDQKRVFYHYHGETGESIGKKEIVLPVDEPLTEFVLAIQADFSDIAIENIEVYGAVLDGICLFPTPEQITDCQGFRSVSTIRTYWANCIQGEMAGKILSEKFMETTGCSLCSSQNGDVSFSMDPAIPANGFRLEIAATDIQVFACDLRGFVMGVETLIKLIDGSTLPLCHIEDAPFAKFRGVHLYLPGADHLEFTRCLIKYLLSPCGYSHIILEMGAGMRFDSHPEINAAFQQAAEKTRTGQWPALPHHEVAQGKPLEKAQVQELVRYARSYGIEVIPEIQSLSHIQYLTLAYPEIAEIAMDETEEEKADARMEDIPPSKFYAHSCCPSNPKTYRITFDILEEILDVVQPTEYVHMGHDEVYQIGICPVCSKKDPALLFAEDVRKYHDYLAARGLKMMIWADMLQPIGEGGKPKPTVNAVKLLPKDIVMMDFIWYFHMDKDIEENLLPHGYPVIYGNMYSSHFPRYESRIRKAGILGGQLSAWVGTSESELAREGKFYDFLYTAQMLWSKDYCGHNRYAYDALLKKQMPLLRCQLEGYPLPSMVPGARKVVIADAGAFSPDAVSPTEIPVQRSVSSLVFRHTASLPYRRLPWQEPEQIAHYRVCYADGTAENIPITYGGNICHWNRRQNAPLPNMFYRHNGYTAGWYCDGEEFRLPDGRIACLYRYEWHNPFPEKTIAAIRLIPESDAETQVILNRIAAVN